MLDAAAAGGYAYPAVNVTSSETLNGALRGLRRVRLRRDRGDHHGGRLVLLGRRRMTWASAAARAFAEFARVAAEGSDRDGAAHRPRPPDSFEPSCGR